ncbi:hypothetical protein F5883DRAFT_413737 [Diaporthe sp. PMI_573]|nr:hypothetical protein F5883DRAFT_413737 [Diaporthaceae sp. PMI_573]
MSSPVRVLALSVAVLALSLIFELPERLSDIYSAEQPVPGNGSDASVLIIGGSHAGLSAALTLARHQIDSLILDADNPRNKWKTPTHTLPTWEDRSPDEARRASRKELRRSGFARFVHTQVTTVRKPGADQSFFEADDLQGRTWRGRKLLLATGVDFVFPDIEGYEDNFPDRILHCLFTRGLEYRGSRSAGLLAMGLAGTPFHAAMLVEDAQKFAEIVSVYTNGNEQLGEDIRKVLVERGEPEGDIRVDNRRITRLTRDPEGSGIIIQLDDGETKAESFLVHQPHTRPNQDIVRQLELETNERNDIVTKMPFYQTNVSGVFAAGDCASPFKMIVSNIFQGSNAGAGIARELPMRVTGHQVDRLGEQKRIRPTQIWSWVLNRLGY